MLYKIDSNGYIINEASYSKIKKKDRKLLDEVKKLYIDSLGECFFKTLYY